MNLALETTLFFAMRFNVFPIVIPDGFTVQLSSPLDERIGTKRFTPSQMISMNKTGDAVIVLDREPPKRHISLVPSDINTSTTNRQRLLILRPDRTSHIIGPPSGAIFATQPFGAAAELDATRHPIFRDLQIVSAKISASSEVFVTQKHNFYGAYSGVDLWSSYLERGQWHAVPAPKAMRQGLNLIVTAPADERHFGFSINYERATNYVGSDAQTGVIDQDEAWVNDGFLNHFVGNGFISAVSGNKYVGFNSHFSPELSNNVRSPDAFGWSYGRRRHLGHGFPWAINQSGIAVGDNRAFATSVGQPVIWDRGRTLPLSSAIGSAYSINDRNQVVGDIFTRGAFLATLKNQKVQFVMLDSILAQAARGWRVTHAYAIASNGCILASGSSKNDHESLLFLCPDS